MKAAAKLLSCITHSVCPAQQPQPCAQWERKMVLVHTQPPPSPCELHLQKWWALIFGGLVATWSHCGQAGGNCVVTEPGSPLLPAAPTGPAANGSRNPSPGAVLLPPGVGFSDKEPCLISLCSPNRQDNAHPESFCGLHSFLFLHLLLKWKAGTASQKRPDKQKWSWGQGSGHFCSALTKTQYWLQLWLVTFVHA